MQRRHERPLRRRNPSGKIVWQARWTDRNGKRRYAGTFELKGACREPVEGVWRGETWDGCCAQHAIDAAYARDASPSPARARTVRGYAETWTDLHPRQARTNRSYGYRVKVMLEVKVDGVPFGDWPMADVRPRHVEQLVDVMLREHGRAVAGARGVLHTLSAMWKDAIRDDAAFFNPFRDATVRASDPRVRKAPRRMRVFSFELMHAMAAAAPGVYGEAMIRLLSDSGLRIGEMLPVERADLRLNGCEDPECRAGAAPHLHVHQTAWDGVVTPGTKTTRGEAVDGRVAPVGPSLAAILRALPPRIDTPLLCPSPRGGVLQNRDFYEKVWYPARRAVPGMGEATPHMFRHSWVSHMRAAGVDVADVADAAGHSIETATATYTHPLRRSYEAMGKVAG